MQGYKLYVSGNYNEAQDYLDKSLYLDPDNSDAWIKRGNIILAMEDYNASIDSYYRALKLNDENGGAWAGLTKAYTALGDYTNASKADAKAAEMKINADFGVLRIV